MKYKSNEFGRDLFGFRTDINNLANFLFSKHFRISSNKNYLSYKCANRKQR